MPPKPRAAKRKRASEGPAMKPVNVTVADLQRSIASLADRALSLPRRLDASHEVSHAEAPHLVRGLTVAGREAAFDCNELVHHYAKSLAAAAEEVRVAAAQLEAYASLLEREAEDEEERAEVAVMARALLSSHELVATGFVAIGLDNVAAVCGVEAAAHMRGGVDPSRCNVSGSGLHAYHAGDNHLYVRGVDGEGQVVECVEAEDVSVSMSVEGVGVTHVAVEAAGVVNVVYCVPEACVEEIALSFSVCGAVLPGSPWTVTHSLPGNSAILATVAPASDRVVAFLRKLTAEWLPHRTYTLLYRGSRDGMTAAAFHGLCDGKGPTLVLIRCDKGFVFGGYADASWESPSAPAFLYLLSSDSFILSVVGPHSSGPVRFPMLKASDTLCSLVCCGPYFHGGLAVEGDWPPSASNSFDGASRCSICAGGTYEDALGKGDASLTGSLTFTPAEIEVFAVTDT